MKKLLLMSVIVLSFVACKNEVSGVRFQLGFGKPKTENTTRLSRKEKKMQEDVDRWIEASKEKGIIGYGMFAQVIEDKYKGDDLWDFMEFAEKSVKAKHAKGEDVGAVFNLIIEAGTW